MELGAEVVVVPSTPALGGRFGTDGREGRGKPVGNSGKGGTVTEGSSGTGADGNCTVGTGMVISAPVAGGIETPGMPEIELAVNVE